MNYHHLSAEERDQLALLRSQGRTFREIGVVLGRSASSLCREYRRNKKKPRWGKKVYYPHYAQRQAEHRGRASHLRHRLKTAALKQRVQELLERRWSPELIAGRLKRMEPGFPGISPEAIYQWIYRKRPDLATYLTRAHRKRYPRSSRLKRRLRIPGRVPVKGRPAVIENRQQAGHWETDLMICRGIGAVQVLVERQTRYSRLCKVPHRTASVCRAALTKTLDTLPAFLRRSITYDNGSENFEHEVLKEDFGIESYFCAPYHSWEKGTVENTNGLIRRFIPRYTVLDELTDQRIAEVEQWLNDRPRKVLQFKTPREAFHDLLVALTG